MMNVLYKRECFNMKPIEFWKLIRRLAWTGGQIGFMLSLSFFLFEITQSWIDSGSSISILRWLVPAIISLATVAILGTLFLIVNIRHRKESLPPEETLTLAILNYGRQLHLEGRDQALINLRNHFTGTLHVLGFHQIRIQLGEISLQSATIIRDNSTKAEILVDDLGWAHYLLGNEKTAIKNIERGIKIARDSRSNELENVVRLSLCEAKGLRHLSIIYCYQDSKFSNIKLEEAFQLLKSLEKQDIAEVRRDIAQLHHAHAMITAMSLGIHKSGIIRLGDTEGIKLIDEALQEVRKAATVFKDIYDIDRYAKALALEVRLLESKCAEVEAREVAALLDRTLGISAWKRPEGRKTLTGV